MIYPTFAFDLFSFSLQWNYAVSHLMFLVKTVLIVTITIQIT